MENVPTEYAEDKIPAFSEPACYRIRIWGKVEQMWFGYFHGMSLSVMVCGKNSSISVLQGQLPDQAALAGILDTLYNMHFTILSVELVEDEDNK